MTHARRSTFMRRLATFGAAFALVAALGVPTAIAEPPVPSEDDINNAREHENAVASDVASIEVELAGLGAMLDSAWEDAQIAGEEYLQAQVALDEANETLVAAAERLEEALESMGRSRKVLAGIALEQFRSGGSLRSLEAVLSAEGITEVIERTNSLEIVNGVADSAVQQFRADSLVAQTMQEQADDAVVEAELAATKTDDALSDANSAQEEAEAAVAQGQIQRTGLIEQLSAARNSTVALETDRQDALDRQRQERLEVQARRDREAQLIADEEAQQVTTPSRPQSTRPNPQPSGPSSPSPDAPGTTAPPAATPPGTTPPTTQPPTTAPPTTRPPTTRPPTTAPPTTRPPTTAPPTTRPPTTRPPTTRPPTTPPPITQPPKPAPPSSGSGSTAGSAAKGRAVVAWAKTQVGAPYVWGASGPSSYDCSGLTSVAWRMQGVDISRTSRSQYQRVKKIPYSQMRPGDLVFYASNTNDSNSIYHVAIYAGNNQIVEALVPGKPLGVSAMRYSGSMPYVGRP